MARKFVSRRHFIEKSVTTGLAVGFALKIEPLRRSESSISPETDGLTLKVSGDATSGYGAVLLFNGRPFSGITKAENFLCCSKTKSAAWKIVLTTGKPLRGPATRHM